MPDIRYPGDKSDDPLADSVGWTGPPGDPHSPAGGNGPGFSASYSDPQDLSNQKGLRLLVADAAVASRARAAFSSTNVVATLERAAHWIGESVLGQIAFDLGVSVGLARSLWGMLKGLYLLPRTFVLAAQYEIALEASHYHLPDSLVRGAMRCIEAGFGLSALVLAATPSEEKKAYEDVQALVREIKSLMHGGGSKVWALLKTFGGKKLEQAKADWDKYVSLVDSGQPGKMYDAGVMFGRFAGELLAAVLLVMTMVGAAIRLARLAASGARVLVELAGLAVEAEGTEIGVAAKTLIEANAELQAARAAGNAERIAAAEKNVAAAAKGLQQKGEAAQQILTQNAPKLVEESGKLGEAKGRAGGASGAGVPEPQSTVSHKSTATTGDEAGNTEAAAGSVKHVNPTGSLQNCTNCVLSVDNQLKTGAPSSALPRSEPLPFSQMEKLYNTKMSGWTDRATIENSLLENGEGTRAVIYGMDKSGSTAHVWNAVVQNGKINYIDGQTGGSGLGNFEYFPNLQFGIMP